jgi:hypothetical protein
MKLDSVVHALKKDNILNKRKLESAFKNFQEKFKEICTDFDRYRFIESDIANSALTKARFSGVESKLNSSAIEQISIKQQCEIKFESTQKSVECLIVIPIDSTAFGGIVIDIETFSNVFWKLSDLLDDDFIVFESTLNSSIKVLVDRANGNVINGDIFVKGSNLQVILE